ncbi:hypothetical protein FHX81_3289 [Saccharothrix saharensis]|uniref:DUF2975 family protein n=1 Tax=Saccharothrix saharensis TaxID=571190 RepID=A0A543JDU0_9PSEU|nr:hypothetical protein [Saccharothrix saharensis]TQM80934.1 hypothetical protein FHX81_3289 [Saccharothrix saharensis]
MARNPLQPFTSLVRFLWSVAAVGVLLGTWQKFGDVCFSSAVIAGSFSAEYQGGGTLRAGASTHPAELRYCLAEPSSGDRVLSAFDRAPSWFAYAALFFLLMRLLERAFEEGIHTAATSDRLRRLGWFTLLALPLVTLVEALVRTLLLRRAVTFDVPLGEFLFDWSVPWWAVVTGVGLLSLAKIMRTSADMRADLEGTV